MSAIFGLLRHDSALVGRDLLRLMAEPVLERAPDGVGLIVEGPLGLGVARLQTCPEPEPIAIDATGPLLCVAAARIDNRRELQSILGLAPDCSDTVIIEHAHRKWGQDAPSHLLGAFAYAVWDRSPGRLTVVRDQIGVRPLYIAQNPAFTAFASDSRSLLALPEVSREIDDGGAFNFFYPQLFLYDRESTWYADIKRLPPAHVLELTADGPANRFVYWSLDPSRELLLASDSDYAEAFRERFEIAVQRRLRCNGGVGSTLSGGLDSSSIAVVAADLLGRDGRQALHTFTAVFPDTPEADETSFSQAVVEHARVVAHQIRPGDQSPLADLSPMLAAVAEPFASTNFFIPYGVCQAARAQGLRVVLDGTDGDAAVGHGVDLFREAATQHDWSHFSREAAAVTERFDNRVYATRFGIVMGHALPELQALASRGRWPAVLRAVQILGKSLGLSRKQLLFAAWAGRSDPRAVLPDLSHLDHGFVTRARGVERLEDFHAQRSTVPSVRRAIHWSDLTTGALPAGLESLDRIGSVFGIEYRYPFCDRELLEFCLAIPCEQQLRNGWSRWILRQALAMVLPEKIRWRGGKGDLAPIYDRGLRVFEQERIASLAAKPSNALAGFIERDAIREAKDQFFEAGGARHLELLWRASVLDAWLKDRG